jgi:hypothetical protein
MAPAQWRIRGARPVRGALQTPVPLSVTQHARQTLQ